MAVHVFSFGYDTEVAPPCASSQQKSAGVTCLGAAAKARLMSGLRLHPMYVMCVRYWEEGPSFGTRSEHPREMEKLHISAQAPRTSALREL